MDSRRMPFLPVVLGLVLGVVRLPDVRGESNWPESRVIAENSTSPDGHYGILVPGRDAVGNVGEAKVINTLADLKAHRVLEVIQGAHYFEGQDHRSLIVTWAPDSSWCAVNYEARYGFGTITLVEPHGANCTQINLGKKIQSGLDSASARQNRGRDIGTFGSAIFRAGPDGKILVQAAGYTNPKSLPGQPTLFSYFEGTFDPDTEKWTRSDSNVYPSADTAAPDFGHSDALDKGMTFSTAEDRLKWYNAYLNEVYDSVRMGLPDERSAAVEKEEIALLKQIAKQTTVDAKIVLIAARIQELRRFFW